MKLNPLERLVNSSTDENEEDAIMLYKHIVEWLEEKPCPVCMDWPDEHAKHCTICDGTRKIYIDYSHLYIPE